MLENGSNDIANIVGVTTSFNATDPRDKVYALLNIARVYLDSPDFIVDYAKSVPQLLKDVVLYAIQGSKTLKILEGNRRCTDNCSPSWIPDSSILPGVSYEWDVLEPFGASRFLLPNPYFDNSSGILQLQGVLIGCVATKFGPFQFGQQFKHDDLAQFKQFYQSASERKQELLWRTLVVDVDRSNNSRRTQISPAPTDLGLMCAVFLDMAQPPGDCCPQMEETARKKRYTSVFVTNMYDSAQRRCVFETKNGWVGLGPEDTRCGDVAVVLFGGRVCFMLRPRGPHYQLVGDCYVQNAMHGQLIEIEIDRDGNVHNAREFAIS